MGERITSLPRDVRSLLRTGVAITHVAQCVEELVVNALDAGATCVAVRVDLPCFKIQVVDNGKGIQHNDLDIIGERYATSKCHEVSDLDNLCYYGYRGEALASLRDITSILEINSRSKHSTQTYCKIFQQGKSLTVTESVIPRTSAGTTVTVHDLFYNLPVRKKCCNSGLDLEKIRQKIEGIALVKPAVSFSLRNDVSGNIILQTHKTNSTLNTFTYLFGPSKSKGLTEVEEKEGVFSVSGYIGKKGCNKKDYQFIYINDRLVLKTKLHKVVNNQLSKSLILRKKLELTSNKFRGHIMTTSPTKTTDQHAMFVLNITCPFKEYDITFEPAKTLVEFKDNDALQHCLEKTITDFLKRESLHLGILAENFAKKESDESPSQKNNGTSDDDDYDHDNGNKVTEKLDFVGLKKKTEIKTTDRNGLFSKIVKRKVTPEDVINTDKNDKNQSCSYASNKSPGQNISGDTSDEDSEQTRTSETTEIGESELSSEMKTPQNKTTALNLSPKVHVSNSSDIEDSEKQFSGNKNYTNLLKKSDHKVCDKDDTVEGNKTSKIRLPVEDSEGELSEDPLPTEQRTGPSPLPTEQRTGPSPPKKQLICIDTPLVKEARINVSVLSKLRKRTNNEDGSPLSTSTAKHAKYTKLKGRDEIDCEQQMQTGNSSCTHRVHETRSRFNELKDDTGNNSHRNESLITSSLQGLRKFRSKEHGKSNDSQDSVNYHPLKHSLQELRKHNTQKLGNNGNLNSSSTNLPHDDNVSGNSNGKHKSQKVVRFQDFDRTRSNSEVSKNDTITAAGLQNVVNSENGENCSLNFTDNNNKEFSKIEKTPDTNNSIIPQVTKSIEPTCPSPTDICINQQSEHFKHSNSHILAQHGQNKLMQDDPTDKFTDNMIGPSLSSPIDIDEACQSLENCVTEIENIISQTLKKGERGTDASQESSASSLKVPSEKSFQQSACEANMENPADKNLAKQFMRSDQMIQTAQEYLQNCKQETETSEQQDKDKSIDRAIQTLEIQNQAAATNIYYVAQPIINVDSRVSASESVSLDNPSSLLISSNTSKSFSTGDSQRRSVELNLPTCSFSDESFEKFNSKFRDVRNIDLESTHIYQNKVYKKPISTITSSQTYLGINKEKDSWNDGEKGLVYQDVSVLSYFDTDRSNELWDHIQKSDEDTSLPFEIYMKYRNKKRTFDNEHEGTDELLLCHETMREIDESQPFFESTQKFSVSEDSGIVTECLDMDVSEDEDREITVQFGNRVPLFKSKTSVSPCLSEGFSPVYDTDMDSESATSSNRQIYFIDRTDTCSTSLSNKTTLSENNHDLPSDLGHYLPAGSHNAVPFPSAENIYSDTSSSSFLIKKNENPGIIQGDSKESREDDVTGSCSCNTFNNSDDLFSNSSTTNSQLSHQICNPSLVYSGKQYSSSVSSSKASFENSLSKINFSEIENKGPLKIPDTNDSDRGVKMEPSSSTKNLKPSQACDSYNLQVFSPEGDLQLGEISRQTQPVEKSSTSSIGNQNVNEIFSPEGDKLAELYQNGQSATKTTGNTTLSTTSAGQDIVDGLFSPGGDSDLRDVQYESKTWVEMTDPKSGKKLYINTRSGNSVSSDEWTPPEDKQAEICTYTTPATKQGSITELSPESSKSLKEMMDHHLSRDEDELLSVKWKDNTQVNTDARKVEDLFKEWENPVFTMAPKDMPSLQVNHMSKASSRSYQALNPCVFDKEMLNTFKVLGQVDNKFIACSLQTTECSSGGEMLVLIDQHAAHERIRLESLTRKAYEVQDDVKVLCHTDLAKDEELILTEEVVRVMVSFEEEFRTIGIRFTVDKKKRDTVILHTLPSCMVQKENTDVKKKKDKVVLKAAESLIKEYVEVLQDTRGSKGRLPNTIHKILCSEACHGAIKFGDSLTLPECEDLLKLLSKCKLPFQCAHGRPSVVPLMQLKGSNQDRKRPNLWKIARHLQH